MVSKFLLSSAICATFIVSVGAEVVQAQVKAPQLIAQVLHPLKIRTLTMSPVNELLPETELIFTLQGTPNASATVSIGGASVPMEEVEYGIYEGRYVIPSGAPVRANTEVKATLRRGYQTVGKVLEQPLVSEIAREASFDNEGNPQSLFIDNFTLAPVTEVVPGTELNFRLLGTPGAVATFSIENVVNNVPMREVSSGIYEGQYVVHRQDDFSVLESSVTARLQSGIQAVGATLGQPLFTNVSFSGAGAAAAITQLPIEILSPQANSPVGRTVEVRGRSIPYTTLDVSVLASTPLAGATSFNQNVLNRRITTDSQGNFSFELNPAVPIAGTRYIVSLSGSNAAGQRNQKTFVIVQ